MEACGRRADLGAAGARGLPGAPAHARTTGITRIQQAGLDYGARTPLRFVIEGDLHLALHGIFLHRTRRLPPTDDVGVTPAAAYIAYCATATVIDAIKVGDWLLRHRQMALEDLRGLAISQLWRPGANEAIWVADYLSGRSRSLPESESRALLEFAGLPRPAVNVPVRLSEHLTVVCDLWFTDWRTAVEYEGGQHQTDRGQFVADIDRYRLMRVSDVAYIQVTKERLVTPRAVVREVHRTLVDRGYDGPPPAFGARWEQLFQPLSLVVGSVEARLRRGTA